MKRWKTRHKVLLGLMLAVTIIMIGCHIHTAIWFSNPETYIYHISISLKSKLILNTLMFIPIYLGTLLLWFLGVKIADAIGRHK